MTVDSPASVAFSGQNLLITNQARNTLDPKHFGVLELPVNLRGLPLNYPRFKNGAKGDSGHD